LCRTATSGKRCPAIFPRREPGRDTTVHHHFALLAQAAAPQRDIMQMIILFGGMFGIFYFLVLRPQQRQLKDHKALLAGLKKGDMVVTQGGIFGKITELTERDVKLEISQGVKIRILKSSIQKVDTAEAPKVEDKKEEK
jgi:preprotein translocase subunit YajC